MKQHKIGIVMNGVTGRMGTNQHLVRSIVAIRNQGGVLLPDGTALMPDPVLVGRNEDRLNLLAGTHGITRWTTDLATCLADPQNSIYFDAQTTQRRVADVTAAINAGKHVYCEKPISETVGEALEMARLANERGVKHGVVQDKLFLPGIMKLKRLISSGFFGRILSVRGEFGYWVFEGDLQPGQRPSWNYRGEDGGGITVDMLCHWRYVLDHVFGPVKNVSCLSATHIPQRWDEAGKPYQATADDAAYACLELEGGIVAQFNSSWTVRVNRDELFEMQVDGTEGSAVAGLRNCRSQHRVNTPKPVWNPDVPNPIDFRSTWEEVPDNAFFDNAFKVQWEMFLKHVAVGTPFVHDLLEGAKGVQLAELALESSRTGRRLDVPELKIPGKEGMMSDLLSRLSLNQITLNKLSLRECVDICVRHQVGWIAPWRNKIAEIGIAESARIVHESGLRVSGLCRGGYFPAPTAKERAQQIDDNLRAIDEAAALGTDTLVLVCGPAPDRDIDAARGMVTDGIAAIVQHAHASGVKLGIEPLHPMFAADRSVICLVDEALDLAEKFDAADVGLTLDTFHIWWDPHVYAKLRRCAGRILAFHVSDWSVPLPGILLGRSMMGSGVIELRRLREAVDAAGYKGPIEVEIMNDTIWDRDADDVMEEVKRTFLETL